MNKVYQINIIRLDNGFIVQSLSGEQITAQNEEEVQGAVKQLVTKLLNEPEPSGPKTQTIKRFSEPEQRSN
jgi:hypothetical protein